MNKYHIRYKPGLKGIRYVCAETVNGFNAESDSYVFKAGHETVAVVPKASVVSLDRIETKDEED